MMHTDPATLQSAALAVGGVVGCACRALVSKSQDFTARKTVADLVIGAIVGIMYPLINFPIPIPQHATLIQQAAFVAGVSYVTDHILQNYFGGQIEKLSGKTQPPPAPGGGQP